MAKEQLRGVQKSRKLGDVAITRWVTKDTVAALGRLRGQGSHANPTEGEVIDQAIADFEEHQTRSFGKSPLEDLVPMQNAVNGLLDATVPNPVMEYPGDRLGGEGVLPVPPSPLEQRLHETSREAREWAEGKDVKENPTGCLHCNGSALAACTLCFNAGHRGNRLNCFLCGENSNE